MAPADSEKNSVQEEARYWLMRQHSGEFSPEESRAFQNWLSRNPEHRAQYARIAAMWRNLDDFKSRSFPARKAARHYRPRAKGRWFPPFQLAASIGPGLAIILTLVVGGKIWLHQPDDLYSTRKGEQRSIALADGSQLEVNTDSVVRVEYTRRGRIVQLEHGEASFTVNHGDTRPFDVIAGAGRIRDIGTVFNVHKRPDGSVVVTVKEGSVSVSTEQAGQTELVQGDRFSYTAHGAVSTRDRIDPAAADAWREGKIIFSRTPLEEAMTQLARYHDIDFVFTTPEVSRLKLSGTFGTRDLPLFLRTLAATLPVESRLEKGVVLLASAHPPASER